MQVTPSHSQRQLVSGKVGWGWRQATYPISSNFGFAGFLMLMVVISQLLRAGDLNLLFIASCLLPIGLILGIYASESVIEVCRQNSAYTFSQWQLIAIATCWLGLVIGISTFSESLTKGFIAIWWILPAAIFAGISGALAWRSPKLKSVEKLKQSSELVSDSVSADVLNVVTYSDHTVFVSPSSLAQQPRQFNSLVLMVLGFFFWTIPDFSSNIRAIAAIAFTTTGITGFFTWQAQIIAPEKILHLRFSGLWGIASEYAIDLRPFSCLSIIKLQEANGELSWMQLSGSNSDITLPLTMTMTSQGKELEKEDSANQTDLLGQTIRQEFHLAKQESERDSLGLANVLLPQGAGILAGAVFVIVGALLLFIFALPTKLSVESVVALLGVCIVSPTIARFFLQLVSSNSLQSDRPNRIKNNLQTWEVGTAILLISAFLATQTPMKNAPLITFKQSLPLLTLICGWLSISIGVCLLAFVRRTPLWSKS